MLEGVVVIVTGGARGIGKACVEIFAADGACVVFSDLSEENGCETEAKIRASGGDVLFVQGNMAVEADVIRMVDAAISKYGRLDGAVNNAGVASDRLSISQAGYGGLATCNRYQPDRRVYVDEIRNARDDAFGRWRDRQYLVGRWTDRPS
ncbi:MAG: SDR family NAD(P)-dependent oxidoreductase [Caenibius sp.]